MEISKDRLLLYAVTDRSWLNGQPLAEVVEELLAAGVTLVQLREKDLPHEDFVQEARKLKAVCQRYGVPLIINDNAQAALEAGADGVHIGQGDMQLAKAREVLGPEGIIGTSAHNVQEAVAAWQNGADYLGCGAVFGSATKHDVTVLDHQELAKICRAVPLPIVAIGGINEQNAVQLQGTGVDGIAVISGLFAKTDKTAAAKEMLTAAITAVKGSEQRGMEDVNFKI